MLFFIVDGEYYRDRATGQADLSREGEVGGNGVSLCVAASQTPRRPPSPSRVLMVAGSFAQH